MSGPSNKSSKAAQKAEQDRVRAISSTQSRINSIFDNPGREGEISDYVGALREKGTLDLNEQKAENDRLLKFALARGGQIGSSTQVDQQRDLSEAYGRGLLDIERGAQSAGADLRMADEDARARLISMATQGLDMTTAAQRSAAAMRTNLESGRATAQVKAAGDVFNQFKQFSDQARESKQRQQALYDAGRNLYGPSAATAYNYGGRG